MRRKCDFITTSNGGRATPARCQVTAGYRVHYRADEDAHMTRDWRRYCRAHAEQYAIDLAHLACVAEVSIQPEG